MKELSGIEVLCSFVTAILFMLTPTVAVADYYVLHFETSRAIVKVHLFMDTDIGTYEPSGSHGLQQEHGSELPSDNNENEESGAVGGVAPPQTSGSLSSPISVSLIGANTNDYAEPPDFTQPLTIQPDASSAHPFNSLPTGSNVINAWLERTERRKDVLSYHIPSDRLHDFVLMFARLVAMEAAEINTCQPFPRRGNHVFDYQANPKWFYGQLGLLSSCGLTSIISSTGFGLGMPGLGSGCLLAGLVSKSLMGYFCSSTQFPKQFQVSFTYRSGNLLTTQKTRIFEHILNMLQCSGGYDLVGFSLNRHNPGFGQTMRFNVRMSNAVNANHLKNWLESYNKQLDNPFQIEVSSINDLIYSGDEAGNW